MACIFSLNEQKNEHDKTSARKAILFSYSLLLLLFDDMLRQMLLRNIDMHISVAFVGGQGTVKPLSVNPLLKHINPHHFSDAKIE